jgi:uncharacterized Tic20 family protein
MSTDPTPSSTPSPLTQDDRTWGMIAHLSALAAFIAPFLGAVLGPLIVWLVKRDQSAFTAEAAKEALNFNITVAIGFAICGVLTLVWIGIPLMLVLSIVWLVLVIVAGIRAGEGVQYRYPYAFRFIK